MAIDAASISAPADDTHHRQIFFLNTGHQNRTTTLSLSVRPILRQWSPVAPTFNHIFDARHERTPKYRVTKKKDGASANWFHFDSVDISNIRTERQMVFVFDVV